MTDKKEWLRRRNEDAKQAHAALMKFYPLDLEDLDGEVWKPIPDFAGYEVSNFGRMKSFKRKKPYIMTPRVAGQGYLEVDLSKNDERKRFYIHRLVAELFIPKVEGKEQVNHIDGHPLNNHVSNLEWVTQSENVQHAVSNSLMPSGQDSYLAKFSNEQVRLIRENPDGLSTMKLGKRFGVDPATISYIQLGKTYKAAGGVIRQKFGVPDEVRSQIRAEYKAGVHGCGSSALAKKYGVGKTTILRIIKGK